MLITQQLEITQLIETKMAQTNSKFFSVMVVGEDPKAIMEDYWIDKKVEPYVKFKFLQAEKYKESAIKVSQKLLEDASLAMINPQMKSALEENVKRLKSLSTFDYYRQLTDGMYYDNEGNALSEKNPNGKWKTCHIGRNFSLPLILKDGTESYYARNSINSSTSRNGKVVLVSNRIVISIECILREVQLVKINLLLDLVEDTVDIRLHLLN